MDAADQLEAIAQEMSDIFRRHPQALLGNVGVMPHDAQRFAELEFDARGIMAENLGASHHLIGQFDGARTTARLSIAGGQGRSKAFEKMVAVVRSGAKATRRAANRPPPAGSP